MGGGGVGEGDGDAVATVVGDGGGAAAMAMGGVVRLRGAGVAMAVMDGGDGSAAAVVSDVGYAVAMRRRLWRATAVMQRRPMSDGGDAVAAVVCGGDRSGAVQRRHRER